MALSDGSVFRGRAFGADRAAVGEVVFNTSMTGYQEIVTDASYHNQIVSFTFPHIGNVGTNGLDSESSRSRAAGIVVKSLSVIPSSWRASETLHGFLCRLEIPGISGVDTRRLTRRLRERGVMNGCVLPGGDSAEALRLAREFPGIAGSELAPQVSGHEERSPSLGRWEHASDRFRPNPAREDAPIVVVLDCGVKLNILRHLADRGLRVRVAPYRSDWASIAAESPDGVLVSNGPGDPEPCRHMVDTVRHVLAQGIPLLGICLGAQLLALASGCRTEKMKFGHHGANHPVLDIDSGQVAITSQNHGFAISADGLPGNVRVTHRSLFDQSIQGIELTDAPAFAFQGHPEASPGPHDLDPLFAKFTDMVTRHARAHGP